MGKCRWLWSLCHYPVWLTWLSLWTLDKSQNPIGHCHNCWKAKVLSLNSKFFCFLNWSLLLSSEFSNKLQDIEKGNHDDEECEEYRKQHKANSDQELPDCEYKRNKSKIQQLLQKVHIGTNGTVTEIQFDIKKNDESKSLQTKMKNLFRRKWTLKTVR